MLDDFNENLNPPEENNIPATVSPIVLPTQQNTSSQPTIYQQTQEPQENKISEVSYYPNQPQNEKKNGKVKAIVKTIALIACVLAISIGSISGYIALTDNGFNLPFSSSVDENEDDDDNIISNSENDLTDITPTTNKEHPTLLQLAAKEGAITIPEIVKKVSPSVVGISSTLYNGTATGTGIIMTSDGYIITNGHVVVDATAIMVVITNNGEFEEYKGTLVGIDTQTDLAVIKVDKTDLTPAEFGKSSELEVGELAIAIGNPLGFELSGSVTGGIISALNRELTIENEKLTLIQTDAAINPGNSGGPLVNCYGQVIGITSAKISSSYAEGLGFAIPIDEAQPIIDDLIEFGYVKGRPMLGISGEDITEVMANYYQLPQGVYVRFINPDSGAADSGIKLADIIVGVEGESITNMNELNAVKEKFKSGETITLTVYRNKENIDIKVKLTEVTNQQ